MSILNRSRQEKSPTKTKVVRFQLDYNLKSLLLDFVTEKDSNLYEELLCQIRDVGQEIRDDDLTQLLKEARGCISILDTNFRLFVQVVLILRWAHRSHDVVDEYKGFLQELCLAHNYYTKQVIDHLVTNFKFDNGEWENSKPSDESLRCFNNLHHVIKSILFLIPMSKEILITSLRKNFPYMRRPYHEYETYVFNMLQIVNYAPQFREEILRIIVSKLIILDTNAPRAELENEMETEQSEEIFEIEAEAQSSNQPEIVQHPIAHTLDVSLTIIYRYIRNYCFPDGTTLDWNKTRSFYLDLNKVFETVILPTHAIHHVQFLVFYMVSFKPTLATWLLQNLWKKVVTPSEAPLIRQSSVFYIASILSRAKYISAKVVQEVLAEMSKWTHSYIAGQENSLSFDFRLHCVFYTICQAIFYVIAFRYRELVQSKGLIFLQSLNLNKIVTCRLNPLRACVPVVATNFASIARNYQLAYCYTIMEQNARLALPQVRRDQTGATTLIQETTLNAFFPFDPYLLKRSYEYIEPHFREYSGSNDEEQPLQQQQQLDDDGEDDFLETADNVQQMTCSPSFNYSTSPGFLHINTH